MMKSFSPNLRVRVPTVHLCPIEWAPDIEVALAILCDFVTDVETGNTGFETDTVDTVRWAVALLWFSSGKTDATGMPALFQLFSASQRGNCEHAAGLVKPFVDEMKPLIETRIARAADMLARFC